MPGPNRLKRGENEVKLAEATKYFSSSREKQIRTLDLKAIASFRPEAKFWQVILFLKEVDETEDN